VKFWLRPGTAMKLTDGAYRYSAAQFRLPSRRR